MAKYIEWYLVELESMLEGRLREDRIHDLLREAKAHLEDTAEQLRTSGMAEKESDLVAIERFGRARRIADEALGNRVPSRLAGRWTMLLMFGAFVSLLSLFMVGPQRYGENQAAFSLLWACIILFGVGAMFVQRVLWKELATLAAVGGVGLSIFAGVIYPAGPDIALDRSMRKEAANKLAADSNAVGRELGVLREWHDYFLNTPEDSKDLKLSGEMTRIVGDSKKGSDGQPVVVARSAASSLEMREAESQFYGLLGFTYPTGLAYASHGLGESYATKVNYDSTGDFKVALKGWAAFPTFAEGLRASQIKMLKDSDKIAASASGPILPSAISHTPFAAACSAAWLAGALFANALFAMLPRVASGRSPRLRRFA